MKLGAHVSTAGGLDKALDRGLEIGCETIQIFGSSPQSWAYKPVPEAQTRAFPGESPRVWNISCVLPRYLYDQPGDP